MIFAQLSARLKFFLRGWLLVLGLKDGLVECATVCVKSVVILNFLKDKNPLFSMSFFSVFCLSLYKSALLLLRNYQRINLMHYIPVLSFELGSIHI
jgi:hypothetical protein